MLEAIQKWCEYQRNVAQITAESARQFFQAANQFSGGVLSPYEIGLNTNISTYLTSVQTLTTIQENMMTRGQEMQEQTTSNLQNATDQVTQAVDTMRRQSTSIGDQLADDVGSFQQSSAKAARHQNSRERYHS